MLDGRLRRYNREILLNQQRQIYQVKKHESPFVFIIFSNTLSVAALLSFYLSTLSLRILLHQANMVTIISTITDINMNEVKFIHY